MPKKVNIQLYKDDIITKESPNIKAHFSTNGNVINFVDDVLTKVTINKDELSFERIGNDYHFILKIGKDENLCTYKLIKKDMLFNINCSYARFKHNKNVIEIIYKIETDEAENKVIISKI